MFGAEQDAALLVQVYEDFPQYDPRGFHGLLSFQVVSVGHIDLNIRLQEMPSGLGPPQSIYVTLLRQNVGSQTGCQTRGTSTRPVVNASNIANFESSSAPAQV